MLTKNTSINSHPLISSITDLINTKYGSSPMSILKEKPHSIIKVGSWVYMDKEELREDSELDLIIVSSNPKQEKIDRLIDHYRDFENKIDLSILSLKDTENRLYNIDIDSVERVGSMSMPSNVIVDDGTYAQLNNNFLKKLIPEFTKFVDESFPKISEKEVLLEVPFEELILFPLMMDVYRISDLASSIDRFFDSDIYDTYIEEYTKKLHYICLDEGITFNSDSFYLKLNPNKNKNSTFNSDTHIKSGVPNLKQTLVKKYDTLGCNIEDIESYKTEIMQEYNDELNKRGLLDKSHFTKESKEIYSFNTHLEDFIF